ncbi:alpha-galactosidase [Amycolatopsis suaedae]|uniref:Alpha-galactosidase n=1 Tax=Amycolatopsis suaedae TaxID=2510978 RepID=A0A4V2EM45_9PSEU|nr:alpha-galactosidase [Amycolatopsis suaedae]RZQ63785.1 alpha-galactosidase [Amycolatopsis suaedae]
MTAIEFDPADRIWLLSTARTAYAVQLTGDGRVRPVYWGPRLTLEQVRTAVPPIREHYDGFDNPEDGLDEFPAEAGARFGPPALAVRFADGSHTAETTYAGSEVDGPVLRIRLADERAGLRLTLGYRVRDEVVERWAELTNDGDAAVTVTRLDSAAWLLPPWREHRISSVTGHWGREFQLRREFLAAGEWTGTSRRGATGHTGNPWVMLDPGDTTEDHGAVCAMALAWSGSWRTTVRRGTSGRVSVSAGSGHEGVAWSLEPGETVTTPVCAGLYTDGGFGAASRSWHDYVRGHVSPAAAEPAPVVYNSWEATGFAVSEAGQRELAGLAAELGVELFVLDDGWFGARTGDNAGLGDWWPSPDRFPGGLKPLADHVHGLGMRFGLWVEPEMVNPDSGLYRAHPDWVLHETGRRRTELRNQLVLNFARDDVAAWALDWLDRLVGEHGIDFLKWDANRPFTEAGWPEAADPGRLWTGHVRAVHSILDTLRQRHPGLQIEACSGGGGRADLGMLARTDQVWTSDNTDPVDRLGIQDGYAQVYPARTMAAWVTDSPNFLTGRHTPLRFRAHVAMTGALGIGGDIAAWPPDALAEARELVALYRRIRHVVHDGDRYRLTPPAAGVEALQYVHGAETVVFAFRVSTGYGVPPSPVPLRALDPGARYTDAATGQRHHGAVLHAAGLPLDLPRGDYASTVVHLIGGR